jgi:transposase InsO family protein
MPWKDVTVPKQRMDFVTLAVKDELPMSELCRRFGISRNTGYKWLNRAAAEPPEVGPVQPLAARLQDRSRRPMRSPSQTCGSVEAAVLQVRQAHPAWGGRKIAHVLARDRKLEIAPSTVTHVLHRHGLISAEASSAATPWLRFEHERPNSLWQMDFKGHFPMDAGRCHALTVLDDHSRFNLVLRACPNERREGVQQWLEEAFKVYGLPDRINTDNGAPWGSSGQCRLTGLGVWLVRLGVKLSYSTPLHPQTNGKEERFHRSLKAEVLQQHFVDLQQVQRAFDAWRDVYNLDRPHQALGMEIPAQRYQPSARSFPTALTPVEYASDDLIRKVSSDGHISFKNIKMRISMALVGEHIGLRPRPGIDGLYDIFFCHQWIAEIDLRGQREA